jgi:hypothetical protein
MKFPVRLARSRASIESRLIVENPLESRVKLQNLNFLMTGYARAARHFLQAKVAKRLSSSALFARATAIHSCDAKYILTGAFGNTSWQKSYRHF